MLWKVSLGDLETHHLLRVESSPLKIHVLSPFLVPEDVTRFGNGFFAEVIKFKRDHVGGP